MLYLTCPTCGSFLGIKTLEWENGSAKICNNNKLSKEEKENELSKLLLSLNFRRYCCKSRIMTYSDIVKIIQPSKIETP